MPGASTAYNATRAVLLAGDLRIARTALARLRGLIGTTAEEFRAGKGLWIVPCEGVHSFGMKFAIDVIYLDRQNRVIHLVRKLKPSRLAAVKLRSRSVLELPSGEIERSGTSIGDRIEISDIP